MRRGDDCVYVVNGQEGKGIEVSNSNLKIDQTYSSLLKIRLLLFISILSDL